MPKKRGEMPSHIFTHMYLIFGEGSAEGSSPEDELWLPSQHSAERVDLGRKGGCMQNRRLISVQHEKKLNKK